jgi:hypothetical protein
MLKNVEQVIKELLNVEAVCCMSAKPLRLFLLAIIFLILVLKIVPLNKYFTLAAVVKIRIALIALGAVAQVTWPIACTHTIAI